MDGIFEALGDPVRRQILEALAEGEQPAGRVVEVVQSRAPISQPAVSQHLRVLREAGLVQVRAEGTRRLYAVDPDGMAAARAWLERVTDPLAPLAPFAQPLDALATELARGRRAGRGAPGAGADGADAGGVRGRSGERGDRLA